LGRCWPQGAQGDALHALSCELAYNIRWLMRALQARALRALLGLLQAVCVWATQALGGVMAALGAAGSGPGQAWRRPGCGRQAPRGAAGWRWPAEMDSAGPTK